MVEPLAHGRDPIARRLAEEIGAPQVQISQSAIVQASYPAIQAPGICPAWARQRFGGA